MTADPKVSPRPWSYDAKLSGSENHHGFVIRYKGSPWALATVQPGDEDGYVGEANAAHIVRCVNAHDGLVEALEEARCTVRMVHREFNSDRFTDRYGDGEIATRRLALIDAALAAAKEGA